MTKKIGLSVVAASMIFAASAQADVDLVISGQAKVYVETNENADAADNAKLFKKDANKGSIGLQFDVKGDLKNDFGFGAQATFLDSAGLEKNQVSNVAQNDAASTSSTDIYLTQKYLTKKIGNTDIKVGTQELPKSLSPFAFSEGWNVFKNTFDAILVTNTDVENTKIVLASITQSNSSTNLSAWGDLKAATGVEYNRGANMLTVANKSLPSTALTLSYYSLTEIEDTVTFPGVDLGNATITWVDAQIDAGVAKIGLQGGNMALDLTSGSADATTAMGLKVGADLGGIGLGLAYTSVNDGDLSAVNVGTGVKTPLYTQQIFNQAYIGHDATTTQLSVSAPVAGGKLIANYATASMGKKAKVGADQTRTELDVIYKIKSDTGIQYFAALVLNDNDKGNNTASTAKADDGNTKVRFWASYGF